MRKITKEITETITQFEAYDGTIFDSEEECQKYDNSAKGLIHGKFHKLIVSIPQSAWDLMGGYEDHDVVAVRMTEKEDLDTVLHYLYFEYPYLLDKKREEERDRIENIINNTFNHKDILLFGINCDGFYYFINSRETIIKNLENILPS